MIVGKIKSRKLITVSPQDTVGQAFSLIQRHKVRHLPVVRDGKLVGIITDRDIRQAFVPVRSGQEGRPRYVLKKLRVSELMTPRPLTVTPQTDVVEAATLLNQHRIGGLPVVENGKLVGIITVTDIVNVFIEMLGILHLSIRLDVVLPAKTGSLEKAVELIEAQGAEVMSAALTFGDRRARVPSYSFRLRGGDPDQIVKALTAAGHRVLAVYR
ncbi:MAG: CBS domain-containing protein [Deltaproteobacteria bacterium]|nr:CBS domain-containing protein [Deltaproteobacteria bacterium]MBI3079472.1 CBS domain-containing protein [Deltaproteobacteria bacterium]